MMNPHFTPSTCFGLFYFMKVSHRSNFRIIVTPKRLGDFGAIRVSDNFFGQSEERIEKDYMRRCDDIADQIKRHVDEVDSVEVNYDVEHTCSHCKYEWEVDENGTPICCDEAIAEHEKSKQEVK